MSVFLHLCLVTFLARLSYQVARSPVLPRFAESLGAGPAWIGWIVGASTLTGVLLKFPAGVVSDRLGRRWMLMWGVAFFAGPPFLYPFVRTPEALLALRFLHGCATALFMPVVSAAVVDIFRSSRAERLGWFSFVAESGAALGPVVGGWFLFQTQSYPWTYILSGVFGTAAWLLLATLPREMPGGERLPLASARGWALARAVAQRRDILLTSGMEACLFLGLNAFAGFVPLFAARHGIHDAQVGVILGAQLVASMVGKPVMGRFSDRLGRKPMIQGGVMLAVAALPWVGAASSFLGLLAISVVLGVARAMVTPSTTALVAEQARGIGHGSAMGIFGTIYDVGDASGPILAGFLIAGIGYVPCFWVIAGIMAAGWLAFSWLV